MSESVADFRRAVRLQESTAQQTSQQSQWAGLYQQGYDTGLSDMVGASMDVLRAGSERRSVELRWLNPLAKSANERLAGADTPPNGVPWDARSSTQVRFTYPAGSVRPDLEFDVVILPARVGSREVGDPSRILLGACGFIVRMGEQAGTMIPAIMWGQRLSVDLPPSPDGGEPQLLQTGVEFEYLTRGGGEGAPPLDRYFAGARLDTSTEGPFKKLMANEYGQEWGERQAGVVPGPADGSVRAVALRSEHSLIIIVGGILLAAGVVVVTNGGGGMTPAERPCVKGLVASYVFATGPWVHPNISCIGYGLPSWRRTVNRFCPWRRIRKHNARSSSCPETKLANRFTRTGPSAMLGTEPRS